MKVKIILAALATLALAGCGNLGCAGAANQQAGAGACTAHVSF